MFNFLSVFQRMITEVLYPVLGPEVCVYLDDILIQSQDLKFHKDRVIEVWTLLRNYNVNSQKKEMPICNIRGRIPGSLDQSWQNSDSERHPQQDTTIGNSQNGPRVARILRIFQLH
jgi:hypothetical protein